MSVADTSPMTPPQTPARVPPEEGASSALADWQQTLWYTVMLPLLAVLLALAAGGLILLVTGYDPLQAYAAMWEGVFGSTRNFSEVLLKATPLIFTGMGIAVAFRCGVWNIGAEGQFYAGAVAATWVGVHGGSLPGVVLAPAVLLAGFIGGGFWAAIPGWLKIRLNISEVVTTIMFNYIAIGITSYLVTGPLQEAAGIFPQSDEIVAAAQLPRIWLPTRLHLGFILAVVLALLFTLLLFRTPLGYAIRTVGLNPGAARYAGIGVHRNILAAMLLSGGAAGLGGAVELAGLNWRLFATISPGYGFDGIAVSLLANNNPLGTIFAGFLFGGLRAASELMQMNVRIPSVLILIIQGLVIAFVVAFRMLRWRRATR
jgi:simple sugar transport system permease protein